MIPPDLDPLVVTNVTPPEPEPEPAPAPPQPEPEPEEPIILTNPDGSYTRMEKSSKGWKATVDIGTGSSQVFYGKTKDELIQNILTAQLNATKKIREQNKKIKLGTVEEATPTVAQTEKILGRKLTADESFEIKTMFEADPDKALDTWFQKRTGSTVDQLLDKAEKGQRASNELSMEQANREFLAANPTYYGDEKYENFNSIVTYLVKHKLRRGRKAGDEQQVLQDLVSNGHYTASNLEEAFTELTEAGLLLSAPRAPEKKETPAPPAPEPPAAPERIVRTETRPRAGLGITSREVTPTRTADPTPPPVEDFNKLTDEQLEALIAAERKKVLASRR
jgi:predicted RNase H-like HicB family nuclease